jgi:hypothetical protein
MPLTLYSSIYTSGSVPKGWKPNRASPLKYPVANDEVHQHLRLLLPGRWQKVIKKGLTGDVHYFEHASGRVADVKFFEQ